MNSEQEIVLTIKKDKNLPFYLWLQTVPTLFYFIFKQLQSVVQHRTVTVPVPRLCPLLGGQVVVSLPVADAGHLVEQAGVHLPALVQGQRLSALLGHGDVVLQAQLKRLLALARGDEQLHRLFVLLVLQEEARSPEQNDANYR